MAGLIINLTDTATPVVESVIDGLRPEKIVPVVARAAVNTTREHLFRLNNERPNALGGKRTNFYAQAARGTSYEPTSTGAVLRINQVGIRLRYFGGTIRPVNAEFLTIPARAEAYGRRAREFNNLRFAIIAGIGPALVEADASTLKRTRSKRGGVSTSRLKSGGETGGGVMFWLRKSVTQRGDSEVLPTKEKFYGDMKAAGRSYVDRLIARTQSSAGGQN